MLGKSPIQTTPQMELFRPLLASFINLNQELIHLGNQLDWQGLESHFAPLYSSTGTPSKPIRLMVGLLILKQLYNLSDEKVAEAWVQNPYYQYFTGEIFFSWQLPCDPSDLVHFRHRIGQQGVQKIFEQSVCLFSQDLAKIEVVNVDTTVQEKNITFPTDTKLAVKIIRQAKQLAQKEGLKLRQSYTRKVKESLIRVRFAHHPKRKKEGFKAMKTIKNIAGRLVRELGRKLTPEQLSLHQTKLSLFSRVLAQKRKDKNKTYSLHEPDVACIAKGKAHKPYEFGSKIGIATVPKLNIVVGVAHFLGNPHDSQTLEATLLSAKSATGKEFKQAPVDRGYRGKTKVGITEIVIPNAKKDSKLTAKQKEEKRKLCRGRAAIEPIISHLKKDFRMQISYLKGAAGDAFNAIMAAAAYNFRKFLVKTKKTFLVFFCSPKNPYILIWNFGNMAK